MRIDLRAGPGTPRGRFPPRGVNLHDRSCARRAYRVPGASPRRGVSPQGSEAEPRSAGPHSGSGPAGNPEMAYNPINRVIGFVDWHTAVIASGAKVRSRRVDVVALKALDHVERVVSDHLCGSGTRTKFGVRLRLYAGWHSGKTPTEYFRGITKVMGSYAGKSRSHQQSRVIFEGGDRGIQLGNRLAWGSGKRLVRHYGVHFLDTLRHRDGTPEEKMVDTALAVDLLAFASRKEADRYVVVSDDDDMLPGIFAAEAAGATANMLGRLGKSSKFMAHAEDLIHTCQSVEA